MFSWEEGAGASGQLPSKRCGLPGPRTETDGGLCPNLGRPGWGKPGSSLTEGSGLRIQKHGLRQRVSFRGPENSLQIHWNEAR